MSITVKFNAELYRHLEEFEVDGETVAAVLFEGGRLSYPARKELEHQLGYVEPYTLSHEARVLEGLPKEVQASIRLLAREAGDPVWMGPNEPTLDLLWKSHAAWRQGVSLDRLVAALVMVEYAHNNRTFDDDIELACDVLIRFMQSEGFPPSAEALEEIFDGAPPACVGLNLVEV